MKRTIMYVLSAVVLSSMIVIGLSCTTAVINGRGATPMLLNSIDAPYDIVNHFEIEKSICFNYTGYVDVGEIISQKLGYNPGNAILNLGITVKTSVGDWFENLFTLGIASCKTYEIQGDVVNWKRK